MLTIWLLKMQKYAFDSFHCWFGKHLTFLCLFRKTLCQSSKHKSFFFGFSSVVSFVRWPLLLRHPASWLSVRMVPPVKRSWGLQSVSAHQVLKVKNVRSWSASTLLIKILMFSFKTSKTGLRLTSHCR